MSKSIAINSDCLAAMREMPDKAFDLAIVDPPYGINAHKGTSSWSRNKFADSSKNWDSGVPDGDYWKELLRVSENQIVWGSNYFTPFLPPSMGWICWYKTIECVGRDYSEFELAYTSFNKAARICEMKPFQRNGTRIHMTQKPVALYKWLLTNYAKPGDTILDTHLGSGSSRIAAYDLGFDFTGYELDKDYFDAQEQRFADHIAQPKLFEPVAPIAAQEAFAFNEL
jgi:site-specific DNA-methyltransferase (adenine-specific)